MILIIAIIAGIAALLIVSFTYVKNLNRTRVEKVTDKDVQDKNIIDHYIKNLVNNDEIEIIKKKIELIEEYIKKNNIQLPVQKKDIATSTTDTDNIEYDKQIIIDESVTKNDELVDIDPDDPVKEKKKKKKNV